MIVIVTISAAADQNKISHSFISFIYYKVLQKHRVGG